MKKFENLGRKLSKEEQKKVIGGNPPGGGACYIVYSTQGYSSCWYTSGSELDLCQRVYGDNCHNVSVAVDCEANNCTMN